MTQCLEFAGSATPAIGVVEPSLTTLTLGTYRMWLQWKACALTARLLCGNMPGLLEPKSTSL